MCSASVPWTASAASHSNLQTSSSVGGTTVSAAVTITSNYNNESPTTVTTATTPSSSALQESISGLVAGSALTFTKSLIKYPLDTATVRLQMPNSAYSIWEPFQLLDGAYRGFLPPLLVNVPAGAIFFGVKDAIKPILREGPLSWISLPSWAQTSLAVAVAQFPYWLVRNPSEVVKTRQQAGIKGFGEGVSAWDAYRKVRDDTLLLTKNSSKTITAGLEGFYVGYWENILYAYPADVIKFVCYELLSGGRKDLSPTEGAVAGAASTALAQLLTTPLDVVRNRVMAQQQRIGRDSNDSHELSPPSYVDSLVQLAQEEGLKGLFAGATPRVSKALVSGAIQFATYEETKQAMSSLFFQKK